jgi:hypothetical protein
VERRGGEGRKGGDTRPEQNEILLSSRTLPLPIWPRIGRESTWLSFFGTRGRPQTKFAYALLRGSRAREQIQED